MYKYLDSSSSKCIYKKVGKIQSFSFSRVNSHKANTNALYKSNFPETNKNSHLTKSARIHISLGSKARRNVFDQKSETTNSTSFYYKESSLISNRYERKNFGSPPIIDKDMIIRNRIRNMSPGPGQYYKNSFIHDEPKITIKGKNNVSFFDVRNEIMPGPGQYNVLKNYNMKSKNIKTSIFSKTTSTRFANSKKPQVPGPGHLGDLNCLRIKQSASTKGTMGPQIIRNFFYSQHSWIQKMNGILYLFL